jgi:broad specificity phosphatase PhoE
MLRHPEAWKRWQDQSGVPEGAEALAAATERMHAVLRELAEAPGGPAIVISHGGVMRLWLVDLNGNPIAPLINGATYACDRSETGWVTSRFD